MKYKRPLAIIGLLLIIAALFFSQNFTGKIIENTQTNSNPPARSAPAKVTTQNLHSYLSQNSIIKELPDKADIQLNLYRWENGERKPSAVYHINKGTAQMATSPDPDITIFLPESYLENLNKDGLCNTLKKANNAGSLEYTIHKNLATLTWRYKSLSKYRSCLG